MSIQSSYCKRKYPKRRDIENLYKKAIQGAKSSKSRLPAAADNLLHFLGGSGSEKVMASAPFKTDYSVQSYLALMLPKSPRYEFIKGAIRRLKAGVLVPGGKAVEMAWTGTLRAGSDNLRLALGGFTLCSNVSLSAKQLPDGRIECTFDRWTVQAFDCYDWIVGKKTKLGAKLEAYLKALALSRFKLPSDNDMCCLQNAGKGKHFRVRSTPWRNTHTPSIAKFIIGHPRAMIVRPVTIHTRPSRKSKVIGNYGSAETVTLLEQRVIAKKKWGRTKKGWIDISHASLSRWIDAK